MFGVLLINLATLFEEVANVVGKINVTKRTLSASTLGFLQSIGGVVLFSVLVLVRHDAFVFSAASLPTWGIRLILELITSHVTMYAVVRSSRSNYAFIRLLTLPFLTIVDLFLGYSISQFQMTGIILIFSTLMILMASSTDLSDKKGRGLVLFTALNAVVTFSLYKYNITHYNSVAAEQLSIQLVVIVSFIIASMRFAKENPFQILSQPRFLLLSIYAGTAHVLESFSFGYSSASVIVASKRSSSLFYSIASGNIYFHEKRFFQKFLSAVILIVGIVFLTL